MKNLENIFYVYVHKTKDTNEIFYVGKGKGNRIKEKNNRNSYWKNIVNKHGYYYEKIIENLKEESAYIQEILAIKYYKPKANFLPGGTGGNSEISKNNFVKNNNLKEKLSIAQKENYKNNPQRAVKQSYNASERWKNLEYKKRVSKKISEALKKIEITEEKRKIAANARTFITPESVVKRGLAISKSSKGVSKSFRTEEHKAKISASCMGRKRTTETILKAAATLGLNTFQVFNSFGECLGEWVNMSECARILNLNPGRIGDCLKGKRKTHKKLIFKYKN